MSQSMSSIPFYSTSRRRSSQRSSSVRSLTSDGTSNSSTFMQPRVPAMEAKQLESENEAARTALLGDPSSVSSAADPKTSRAA